MKNQAVKTCIAAILLVAVLLVSPASSTTYYVTKNGSDGNTGTDWGNAWATVGKVNSTISAGDVVHFLSTDKWSGSQIVPPTGGTNSTVTHYKSMTADDVYAPFGATISGGDSLGGGWVLDDRGVDSVYKRAYTPTLQTFGEQVEGVTQGDSILPIANNDGAETCVIGLEYLTAPGEMYYDVATDSIYVLCYNIRWQTAP
ncbi:MAG: hypothetical protein ABIK83_11060 [Candidatus Zixiibacteriota bacterium]